jgi:hypothetical protein
MMVDIAMKITYPANLGLRSLGLKAPKLVQNLIMECALQRNSFPTLNTRESFRTHVSVSTA